MATSTTRAVVESTSSTSALDLEPMPDEKAAMLVDGTDLEKSVASTTSRQPEYLQGWKHWGVVTGVTLVFFLMLLDTSILATVRRIPSIWPVKSFD